MNIKYPWQLMETLRTIIDIAKKNKRQKISHKTSMT